jgi:hypothetical protein
VCDLSAVALAKAKAPAAALRQQRSSPDVVGLNLCEALRLVFQTQPRSEKSSQLANMLGYCTAKDAENITVCHPLRASQCYLMTSFLSEKIFNHGWTRIHTDWKVGGTMLDTNCANYQQLNSRLALIRTTIPKVLVFLAKNWPRCVLLRLSSLVAAPAAPGLSVPLKEEIIHFGEEIQAAICVSSSILACRAASNAVMAVLPFLVKT